MDRYGSCGALIDTHDAYTPGRHDRYPRALDTAPCLQGLGTCVSPRCRPDIGQRSFYDKAIQGADTFSKNRDAAGMAHDDTPMQSRFGMLQNFQGSAHGAPTHRVQGQLHSPASKGHGPGPGLLARLQDLQNIRSSCSSSPPLPSGGDRAQFAT